MKHAQETGASHLDFLHRLLADQAGLRRQRGMERRIKEARFRDLKPLAEFDWSFNPSISRVQIETLAATGVEQPVLAVDGKTLRRSHDRKKDLGALHSVSVWASEFGLSLGQVSCAEKSNEITAIPELLRLVDIKGTIITIDAMGTQKAIAAQIVDSGADYVLAVKGNQETLERGLLEHIDKHLDNDFADANARRHVTVEKGHGREEVRTYVQMPVPKDLPEREKWKGLRTIGMATLLCTRDGQHTSEVRYFISSLPMGVKCFACAVRSHWGIENSCHWSLDMTYREDESRIRDRHVAENSPGSTASLCPC